MRLYGELHWLAGKQACRPHTPGFFIGTPSTLTERMRRIGVGEGQRRRIIEQESFA